MLQILLSPHQQKKLLTVMPVINVVSVTQKVIPLNGDA
jgi:hypothetical protein